MRFWRVILLILCGVVPLLAVLTSILYISQVKARALHDSLMDMTCSNRSSTWRGTQPLAGGLVSAVLASSLIEPEKSAIHVLKVSTKALEVGDEVGDFLSSVVAVTDSFNLTLSALTQNSPTYASTAPISSSVESFLTSARDLVVRQTPVLTDLLRRLDRHVHQAAFVLSLDAELLLESRPADLSSKTIHDVTCFYAEVKDCIAAVDHVLHDVQSGLVEERSFLFATYYTNSPILPHVGFQAAAAMKGHAMNAVKSLNVMDCIDVFVLPI
ncbi:hypothetical protein EWM64_g5977 [Hericium alpestre]|uniref:Uncharacterized protein n=1 Tax=Hericium alpestre TaxID=135208 RepID=A0A4Y9ZVG9_9AGAM|nr:hypothetical protein EWM64_g5977 [Hericium alpestre]